MLTKKVSAVNRILAVSVIVLLLFFGSGKMTLGVSCLKIKEYIPIPHPKISKMLPCDVKNNQKKCRLIQNKQEERC